MKFKLLTLLTSFTFAQINSPSISCSPAIVGTKLADLTVQFFTSVYVPVGSTIYVTAPQQATVQQGYVQCAIAGFSDVAGLSCSGLNQTLQFPVLSPLQANQQNVFTFRKAFNTPATSDPTSSFNIRVVTPTSELQSSGAILLNLLSPNKLQSVSIMQTTNSSTVVGSLTNITFSMTTLNPIPAGGGVKIDLPKWNTAASGASLMSYINNATCAIGSGMQQIQCNIIITPTGDTLVVKNMFPTGRLAGDTFTFSVNNVLNPLSMSSVSFVVTTYSSITFEIVGQQVSFSGFIDSGLGKFTAGQATQIPQSSAQISADDSTVWTSSQLIIPFTVPVPIQLSLGCTILITLPDDFTIQAGQLTVFRGWGIFPGVADLLAQVDETQRTIKIADQCVQYTAANQKNTIRIGQIQNPPLVKATKDFKIQVFDINGQLIAQVLSGVTYIPTPGTFTNIALNPKSASPSIQDILDVDLVFTPLHQLSPNSKILINMPVDLPAKCDITLVSSNLNFPITCMLDQDGTIVLQNPFNTTFAGNQPITITFRGLKLPNSQRPILGITLKSFDQSGGIFYQVDYFTSQTYQFFTPQSISFLSSQVTKLTSLTYTETQFTISNTIASDIPVGSTVVIIVPPEITVTNQISVMSSCSANTSPNMTCFIEFGKNVITLYNAFPVQKKVNDVFIVNIARGLLTPISTETSSSFQFTIFDSKGFQINYVKTALTVTMQQGIPISTLSVTPDSFTVGATSMHTVNFTTPVPILPGFNLQVFVPSQIETPRAINIKCIGAALLVQNLICQLNGNRVTIQLQTTTQVAVGSSVSFQIGPFVNPGSTHSTDPYKLTMRSPSFYDVADATNNAGGQVQMQQPSTITNYDFSVLDPRQLALTTVTINWVSTQTYLQKTNIVINYNNSQISPNITNLNQTVPCIFRQSKVVPCSFGYNTIYVKNFLPSDEFAGNQMALTITNMQINVLTPLVTTSWNLTTYLADGVSKIDTIQGGMSIAFQCNYPCQTCALGQPDVCTSCNQIAGNMILYNNKCYSLCPTGTFFQYFQCQLCDTKCKTCEYTSGSSCQSCNSGSPRPYLNGKDCSDKCNYGQFGNSQTGLCESCTYPCEQCSGTAGTCTSCRQDALEKFYYNNMCLTSCPTGHYVQLEAMNNVCLPCSSNCLTCSLTANTCQTCPPGLILNLLDNTCVKSCPAQLSIYQPANSTVPYPTCEPCKSSCNTCSGTFDTCTSCSKPLSLNTQQSKCVLECDVFFNTQVSIKNVCVGCSSSCKSCQGTPDYCISCVNGTYFYQNHCVQQCPLIDDYQFEPDATGTCVIPGLICPFGYKVTYAGTGCELKNQVCETNFELNHDKTACIPISTFYIPFPMLITLFILSFIPIISKIKRKTTLIVPNLTIVASFMESICIIVLVAQAKSYGITPTCYIAIVGLIFLLASNAFFMLMYVQQVKTDSAFKHWNPKHTKVSNTIQFLGMLNYKMYRLLYSLLFGLEQFHAPFNEPNLFFRPFNLTSLFAIVTVTVPLTVASAIGLIYVRWGYQLYVTCIEMLIIEGILLGLQITEYVQQQFVQKKLYKVTRTQVEVNVKSDFPDSDENDEYGTKKESKSKPRSIKAVRQLLSLNRKMANKQDFQLVNIRLVEKEIQDLHEEDMMVREKRHCKSVRHYRPNLDEAFSGDEEYDKWQDFISEPSSPRAKEMLWNGKFIGRMHFLHDVYKMRDQYDNCYNQQVDKLTKNTKGVDHGVQTNVLELLGIDDAIIKISEDSCPDEVEEMHEMIARPRMSKKRMAEIPDFDLHDIQGDFEADETGQFLLIQKQGRLHDKKQRLVNSKGYLIDQIGNVITRSGKLMFYVEELEDNDIPEPFSFQKIKSLESQQFVNQFRVTTAQKLKYDFQKQNLQVMLLQDAEERDIKTSQSSVMVQETFVQNEDDCFIEKVTKPKKPKTKTEFKQAQARKAQSQASAQQSREQPVFEAMQQELPAHRVEQLGEGLKIANVKQHSIMPKKQIAAKYVPGVANEQLYQDSNTRMHKLMLESDFQDKMDKFNQQLNQRRKEFLNNSQGGKYLVSDFQVSDIGSNLGMAHRNLSSVYGRVKQKFQKHIQGPSASILKRMDYDKMHQLEEIYLHPRIGEDVNRQVQGVHHLKPDPSQNQLSEVRSHITLRK